MHKRQRVVFIFILCAVISFLSIFARTSLGSWISRPIQFIFSPAQKTILHASQSIKPLTDIDKAKQQIAKLQAENAQLQLLLQDNKALRDQFQTVTPPSVSLIPSEIVSMPQFVPGMSAPEDLIISASSGIRSSSPVVYQNMIIGKISDVTSSYAKVILVSSKNISFTARTAQTGAIGIIKGQGGGQVIFDNVLLSDSLKIGDMVVTSGETSFDGKGISPGLIVGKIISVEKNPSSLFQKASVQTLLDVTHLTMVFVLAQ